MMTMMKNQMKVKMKQKKNQKRYAYFENNDILPI